MQKLLLALAFFLFAGMPVHAQGPQKVPVVATFSILGDVTRIVGGAGIDVITLVGTDGNPHAYEPKPEDIKALSRAKILVTNGLDFEPWLPRLIETANFKGTIIVASKLVKPLGDPNGRVGKKFIDPHAWQDLSNGTLYVQAIADGIELVLPDDQPNIQLRANQYIAQIRAMDAKIRETIKDIPAPKRRIMTSHKSFGYFGAAYNVEFLAPVGFVADAEPSAQTLAMLIRQMKQQGITTVFFENMTNPRIAEQLAKEAHAKVGGALYSDALSDAKGPAPNYLAMFESNLPKLVKAMQENDTR